MIEHDALEDSQHYISMADNREKEQIKKIKALPPPTLTEQKFIACHFVFIRSYFKKNLKLVSSIYNGKWKLINLYDLHEMANSFNGLLEKFKNSLENKSYGALDSLALLKDSKMLDELKGVLTGPNEYLQKEYKKASKNILHTMKKER